MGTITNKSEVLNPLTLSNTVGQELHDFFEANSLDIKDLSKIGIDPIRLDSVIRFTKQEIRKIGEFTKLKEIESYLENFQNDYSINKTKAEKSFSKHKKNLSKSSTLNTPA